MSIDLKDEGVTSVLLHPGWVRTAMTGGELNYRQAREPLADVFIKHPALNLV